MLVAEDSFKVCQINGCSTGYKSAFNTQPVLPYMEHYTKVYCSYTKRQLPVLKPQFLNNFNKIPLKLSTSSFLFLQIRKLHVKKYETKSRIL